jgi:probable rRNA maturation factor
MAAMHFFSQDIPFKLRGSRKIASWVKSTLKREGLKLRELNFVFCSDEYLSALNTHYLKHKSLTDIITFDNSDEPNVIEGDVFISIDRVRENAKELAVSVNDELHRVIIHGVLHLAGYSDKTPAKKKVMRKKEDAYLSLL